MKEEKEIIVGEEETEKRRVHEICDVEMRKIQAQPFFAPNEIQNVSRLVLVPTAIASGGWFYSRRDDGGAWV